MILVSGARGGLAQNTPTQLNNLRKQVNQAAPASSPAPQTQTKPPAAATGTAKPAAAKPAASAPVVAPAPQSQAKVTPPATPANAKSAQVKPAAPQAVKPVQPKSVAQTKPATPASPSSPSAAAATKTATAAPANPQAKPVTAAKTSTAAPEAQFAVEHVNVARRDPFDPLVEKEKGPGSPQGPLPAGKPGLVVATLRVDGIVKDPTGMIAVVSNPQMRVYFLREGDRLYDGEVEHISMEGVSFHETGKDAFGKMMAREVTKRLYPLPGEQQ
jgi:hypothetical protein